MINLKYAVDRVEDKIVVLQCLDSGKIKEINKEKIDFKVTDGDILIYENNKYIKIENEKEQRLKVIQDKLNQLKELQ